MSPLLFIGNSHLAAVKLAWEAAGAPKAEFFGAPQRAWARMTLLAGNAFGLAADSDHARQRKIVETANGKSWVSLSDRKVIVLVGSFSAAERLATLLSNCDVAGLRDTGAPTLLSSDLFARACTAMAEHSLPPQGFWHRSDARVVLMPRPAPCETCLVSTHAEFQPWHRIASQPDGMAKARATFDATLAQVFAARGLTYIPQPAATLIDTGLTAARYLAEGGGAPQGQEHKRGDHAHMNQAYGTAAIAPLITWLTSHTKT